MQTKSRKALALMLVSGGLMAAAPASVTPAHAGCTPGRRLRRVRRQEMRCVFRRRVQPVRVQVQPLRCVRMQPVRGQVQPLRGQQLENGHRIPGTPRPGSRRAACS